MLSDVTLFSTTIRTFRAPSRLRRRVVGLAAAAALALTLSACGDDYVGAAADVGGTSIGESELVAATDARLAGAADPETGEEPGDAQRSYVNRQILTEQIRHALLPQIASDAGISVSDQEVNETIGGNPEQAAQTLGIPVDRVSEAVRDFLLVSKIAQRDSEAGEQVTDVIVKAKVITAFPDRDAAVAARETFLSDPAALEAAIAEAGPTAAGDQEFSLIQTPGVGLFGIFTAQPDDIVLVNQGSQVLLVKVVTREESPSDQLAASMSQQQSIQARIGVAWLAMAERAADVDVAVNPRFGIWDPASMSVAPTSAGL